MRKKENLEFKSAVNKIRESGGGFLFFIVVILAASFILRIMIVNACNPPMSSDANDYFQHVYNLAHGKGYGYEWQKAYNLPNYHGDKWQRAYRIPGYPLIMLIPYSIFGWNLKVALWVNIFAEMITQICFLIIAVRLFSRLASLAVCIILGLNIIWTPNPMTESVFTAIFSVIILIFVFNLERVSRRWTIVTGILIAAAVFIRPIAFCLYPIVILKLRIEKEPEENDPDSIVYAENRKFLKSALFLILPLVLLISVWTIRNYIVLKEFVPLSTNFGSHNARDFGINKTAFYEEKLNAGFNEAEINKMLVKEIKTRIKQNPGMFIKIYLKRIRDLYSLNADKCWELNPKIRNWTFYTNDNGFFMNKIHQALYYLYYPVYIFAFLCGIIILLSGKKLSGIMQVLILYTILQGLISRGDVRFAAPVYPILVLLASSIFTAFEKSIRKEFFTP